MQEYWKWKDDVLSEEAHKRGIVGSDKFSRRESMDSLKLWDMESEQSKIGEIALVLNFLAIFIMLVFLTQQPAGQLPANIAIIVVVVGIASLIVNGMLGLIKVGLGRQIRRFRKNYQPKEKQ